VILSVGGKVDDPAVVQVLEARTVNHALGGAVVGPGDVNDLQDDFIDTCRTIVIDAPVLREKARPKDGK
jgi:hypothetical protein